MRAPVLGSAGVRRCGSGGRHPPRVTTTAATAEPIRSASLPQSTTRNGKRASTYQAFLEGEAEGRENLDVDLPRPRHQDRARGRVPTGSALRASSTATAAGETAVVHAAERGRRERRRQSGRRSCCCCPGSGPERRAARHSASPCRYDAPDVGKHLQGPPAARARVLRLPGIGVSMAEVGVARWDPTPCVQPRDRCRPIPPMTPRCSPRAGGDPGRSRAPRRWVGDDRPWVSCLRRCMRRAPGTRPALVMRTPMTPRSGSSSAATTPTSGATACASTPTEHFDDAGRSRSVPTAENVIVLANP